MTVQLRRSVVFGGIGLTLFVWLFENVSHSLGEWAPAIVVGSGIAWLLLQFQPSEDAKPLAPVNLATVKTALTDAEGVLNQLALEARDLTIDNSTQQLSDLRSQINQITTDLQREEIRIAVMGGKSVGKTSLTQLLQSTWASELSQQLSLTDTPELFAATDEGIAAEREAWNVARSADLILFLTNGDLTATQLQVIRKLTAAHKRTVLVFNKQDHYLPDEQQQLLHQLRQRLDGILTSQDVTAIATNPKSRKVRQHLADGSVKEWLETPAPQISALTDRLSHILMHEGKQLVLASSFGNANGIKTEAKKALNTVRRDRAVPLIDQAQWIVATTAFANPFPALDLLAAAAINAQMVMDLSKIYQQKFSLAQAKTVATTMASLMVKLGVVEVSTQAIATVLKTNVVTYVAGGLLQGVSAAYLTRLAGLTLIEYFEDDIPDGEVKRDLLKQIMEKIFQQNQRIPFLQAFVKQAVDKLKSTPLTPKMESWTTEPTAQLPAPQEQLLQMGATLDEEPRSSQSPILLEMPHEEVVAS